MGTALVERRLPSLESVFSLILLLSCVTWGLQGGVNSAIMDCDETFNYIEPLHYATRGRGRAGSLQTWEYAPDFALRSWFYIELHAVVIRLLGPLALTGPAQLLAVRIALHVASVLGEALLALAVGKRWASPRAVWFSAVLLGINPGMGHARHAMLPSSTVMICVAFGFAAWLERRASLGLVFGAFAVLVAWPFAALTFVPMGLDALRTEGFFSVLAVALGSLLVFAVLPVLAAEAPAYGRLVWPTLQMILYNALGASGGGAHLYGVEPWTYYPSNLFLNLNAIPLLGTLGLAASALLPGGLGAAREVGGILLLPMGLTFALFQSMPHKEERFLFQIYPILCVAAGLALARVPKPLGRLALAAVAALGVSRSAALSRFASSTKVYSHLPLRVAEGTVCVGREWHRFPSSFHLPTPRWSLGFTKSAFRGQLPSRFSPAANGTATFVGAVNDMNREELDRYTSAALCEYYVDHDEPTGPEDEIRPEASSAWVKVGCDDFIDAAQTKQPYRSFAGLMMGGLTDPVWAGVAKRQYCLFKRA